MSIGCNVCKRLSCVCAIETRHAPACRFRVSATCPVEIGCDAHGRGTCPVCDACDCDAGVTKADLDGSDVLLERWNRAQERAR
jgi:hypothetical protein